MRGFYFITDGQLTRHGLEHDVAQAVAAGAVLIQYRFTQGDTGMLMEEAGRLKRLAGAVPFIVNNRIDIARAVGADGVHLGRNDPPIREARQILGTRAIVGASVDSVESALAAAEAGASYLAVSPVYASSTKPDAGPGLGTAMVAAIRGRTRLPLAVIGGITPARALACREAGADLVCAIGATLSRPDLQVAIHEFKELFQ
jgi:thiamine-phosphate pyrophosphorylase